MPPLPPPTITVDTTEEPAVNGASEKAARPLVNRQGDTSERPLENGHGDTDEAGHTDDAPRQVAKVTFSDAVGVREVKLPPSEPVDIQAIFQNGSLKPGDDEVDRPSGGAANGSGDMVRARAIFRAEMHRLYEELIAFKRQCTAEMVRCAKEFEQEKETKQSELRALKSEEDKRSADLNMMTIHEEEALGAKNELAVLQIEKSTLDRRQSVIDLGTQLVQKEDELSRRQSGLVDYENEIEEIERFLDRRFEMAKRKEEEVLELDEDLRHLKTDLEGQTAELHNKRDRLEEERRLKKASDNWEDKPEDDQHDLEFVKKSLLDKQNTLEAALRRCKEELTTAENTIEELEEKLEKSEQENQRKSKKIKDLEERMSATFSQMAALQMRTVADVGDDDDVIPAAGPDQPLARKRSSVYLGRRESTLAPLSGANGYGPTLSPARRRHSLRPTSAGGASNNTRLSVPRGSMANLSLSRSNSVALKTDRSNSHANISRSFSETAAQRRAPKSKACVIM